MNTATAHIQSIVPRWTSLRTFLAAGAGTLGNIFLALVWGIALFMPLDSDSHTGSSMAPWLTAEFVVVWGMTAGARLIGLSVQSARLCLPRVNRQAMHHGVVAMFLVVLIPDLLLALTNANSLIFNFFVLTAALLLGLFLTSAPRVFVLVSFVLGAACHWLLQRFGAWPSHAFNVHEFPPIIALALVLLPVGIGWCWWRMTRYPIARNRWFMPAALAFTDGPRDIFIKSQQESYSSSLFTQSTPIGHDLRRHPNQALGIALGPGFGHMTLKNFLISQGAVFVALLPFMLLDRLVDGNLSILFVAPLLAILPSVSMVMRLYSLSRYPSLGLHELALLPSLPRPAALAFFTLLWRHMLLNALPALIAICIMGRLWDVPSAFYPLACLAIACNLFWLCGMGLLMFRSGALLRGALILTGMALAAGNFIGMFAMLGGQSPRWLLPAWCLTSATGAFVSIFAQYRLRKLPHPWLQN